ncbi:alpha/beta fold hydrolase [Bdellovibrio sp. HCB337]|uniref:alpha/beta fold hydrolase n=1 Tax=Bdellovibrio sp. HCB337 TaxID=3394358 RepID=UPI0039A6D0E2
MSDQVETSEQFVDVPGGKVFVRCWTPSQVRNQTPVVLLHDSLGCVEMWRDFPQKLSEKTGRVIFAYDRLGFGRSSPRTELPSVRFVSEEAEIYLPAVLKALNLDKFALFGHSVGGAMAVIAAGTIGKNCTQIITESAQAFVEDRTRAGITQAKSDFADPKIYAKLEKYHGEKTRWVLSAWIDVWLSEGFANWSLQEDLLKVKCPALVIHGDKDEYGSVKFPEMIAGLAGGPSEKHVISGCGHVPHREMPDLILSLVTDFLKT